MVAAGGGAPAGSLPVAPDVPGPVLFFDGTCGFCDRAVRFAMSRDVHGRLRAAPLGGETARRLLVPFLSMLDGIDSTVLYLPPTATQPSRLLVYSDAALATLRVIGGVWSVPGVLGHAVPRWLRDVAYKAFAKRRFRLFGHVEACELWPAEWRARMLP